MKPGCVVRIVWPHLAGEAYGVLVGSTGTLFEIQFAQDDAGVIYHDFEVELEEIEGYAGYSGLVEYWADEVRYGLATMGRIQGLPKSLFGDILIVLAARAEGDLQELAISMIEDLDSLRDISREPDIPLAARSVAKYWLAKRLGEAKAEAKTKGTQKPRPKKRKKT